MLRVPRCAVYDARSDPVYGHGQEAHHRLRQRMQCGHDAGGSDGIVAQILRGPVESPGDPVLAVIGADRAHALELLARLAVDGIDEPLHPPDIRDAAPHDERYRDEQDDHCDGSHGGPFERARCYLEEGPYGDRRGLDDQGYDPAEELLYLIDVVGGARDERGHGERIQILAGPFLDLPELPLPQGA